MKKSSTIRLRLIPVILGSLTMGGCSLGHHYDPVTQRCVDQNGIVLPNANCQNTPNGNRWYYGGRGINIGDHADGGTFDSHVGGTNSQGTTHGFFGSHGGSGAHA